MKKLIKYLAVGIILYLIYFWFAWEVLDLTNALPVWPGTV